MSRGLQGAVMERAQHERIAHQHEADAEKVVVKHAVFKAAPTIDREQRLVKGVVTTTAIDLDDEVVVPSGLDLSYFPKQVAAVYLDHLYARENGPAAVGTCRRLSRTKDGDGLWAQTYILPTALGDEILTAIEAGALGGLSIGAKAIEAGPPTDEERERYGDRVKSVLRRGLLLEYSFTSMPCNPDALLELEQKGKIRKSTAVLFGLRPVTIDLDTGITW
jgi:hypothetical protein